MQRLELMLFAFVLVPVVQSNGPFSAALLNSQHFIQGTYQDTAVAALVLSQAVCVAADQQQAAEGRPDDHADSGA